MFGIRVVKLLGDVMESAVQLPVVVVIVSATYRRPRLVIASFDQLWSFLSRTPIVARPYHYCSRMFQLLINLSVTIALLLAALSVEVLGQSSFPSTLKLQGVVRDFRWVMFGAKPLACPCRSCLAHQTARSIPTLNRLCHGPPSNAVFSCHSSPRTHVQCRCHRSFVPTSRSLCSVRVSRTPCRRLRATRFPTLVRCSTTSGTPMCPE